MSGFAIRINFCRSRFMLTWLPINVLITSEKLWAKLKRSENSPQFLVQLIYLLCVYDYVCTTMYYKHTHWKLL